MAKAPKVEIKPGDLLGGKYRIERVIGQGGMGIVAAARHVELHQRVAIKVLPTHLAADKDLVERFMREARAAARLRSEHSVKTVDVGTRSNGSPYIVMELLDGEDLGAVVERGPLPIEDAVNFILQACEAVAEAHALGIVHRDLKPRNLFLTTKLHGRPLVKVLDFGLAKRVDMLDRQLTATAAVMGSPQYMSPEQMRSSRDIDFRTDVWSLGVCLYELVSAHVPFDAGAVPVLCAMVLKEEPAPLPRYRPDVPQALWAVIQKCLRKNPAERFTTVSDLAVALEPFAPAHAHGAAQRISAVLFSLPQEADLESAGLATGPEHEADGRDTRTSATFDSNPQVSSVSSLAWIIGGVAAFTVFAVIGGVLLVLALRPARAAPPRGVVAREYEGALEPLESTTPTQKDDASRSDATPTGVPRPPTGPATGGGQSKGPKGAGGKPAGSAEAKPEGRF